MNTESFLTPKIYEEVLKYYGYDKTLKRKSFLERIEVKVKEDKSSP